MLPLSENRRFSALASLAALLHGGTPSSPDPPLVAGEYVQYCKILIIMKVVIYTDGGSRNNPGNAGIGAVIYMDGEKKAELSEFLGVQTNNWAEYEAVFHALSKARELELEKFSIEVRLDSKLVVEQLARNWKIKEPTLRPQAEKIWEIMKDFSDVNFTHIPREDNTEADALANEAMDRGA